MTEHSSFVVKTSARYLGGLRCEASHEQSGRTLATAAPVDNQGDGSSFSPTDLTGVSLATCMLTTMAMAANRDGIDLGDAKIQVEKQMTSTPPRRIARLSCTLTLPAHLDEVAVTKLRRVAQTCPVYRSLHPDLVVELTIVAPLKICGGLHAAARKREAPADG